MKVLFAILVAAGLLGAAELKLGKPFSVKEPVSIATLLAHPDDYAGKTVQVKGKIAEVCQMMGCWMDLVSNGGQKIRIKVNDGEIVFPKDTSGKAAVAEGRFTKTVLTRDQAITQVRRGSQRGRQKVRSGVREERDHVVPDSGYGSGDYFGVAGQRPASESSRCRWPAIRRSSPRRRCSAKDQFRAHRVRGGPTLVLATCLAKS
jgi:hypothetical protein